LLKFSNDQVIKLSDESEGEAEVPQNIQQIRMGLTEAMKNKFKDKKKQEMDLHP